MYTQLVHSDLKEKTKKALKEAWTFQATLEQINFTQLGIEVCPKDKQATWVRLQKPKHTKKYHRFTFERLFLLLEFLIDNSFVLNGCVIRRQQKGIPMGTNAGQDLANLYLYYYESSFIDTLILKDKKQEASSFHLSFRLIDDVLSLDNPSFNTFLNHFYREVSIQKNWRSTLPHIKIIHSF
jgi:hypothetical protein